MNCRPRCALRLILLPPIVSVKRAKRRHRVRTSCVQPLWPSAERTLQSGEGSPEDVHWAAPLADGRHGRALPAGPSHGEGCRKTPPASPAGYSRLVRTEQQSAPSNNAVRQRRPSEERGKAKAACQFPFSLITEFLCPCVEAHRTKGARKQTSSTTSSKISPQSPARYQPGSAWCARSSSMMADQACCSAL